MTTGLEPCVSAARLPRRVPDLRLDGLTFDAHRAGGELHAYRADTHAWGYRLCTQGYRRHA